jgi:predicted glycoside hydrolase/deacetylase ChbG (UPF0249 family)
MQQIPLSKLHGYNGAVTSNVLAALGVAPDRRAVIPHQDDVGMCHGANRAFFELAGAGFITCGSVMVPCPWFPEIAEQAAAQREIDLGVHLTLTSEWPHYRWRPLTIASRASGLLDEHGYFPRNVKLLAAARPNPEAVEIELTAQVDRALAAGIDVTHLDTHMGACFLPELLDVYARLGERYRVPVLLPRRPETFLGELKLDIPLEPMRAAARRAESGGMPLVDEFRMTPGVPSSESDAAYRTMIGTVPAGLTFLSVHPNTSGDIETIVPPRAHWRTDEHRIFTGKPFRAWLAAQDLVALGFRPLRELMRQRAQR